MAKKTVKGRRSFKEFWDKVTGWSGFWIVKNLLIAVLIVLTFVFGSKWFLNLGTRHGDELEVPDFRGKTIEEAMAMAENLDIRLEVVDSVYSKKGRGTIREHNPAAGSMVKEGRRILVTVNAKGAKKVAMPNLVGYSTRQAVAELRQRGLVLGRLSYVSDIATNNVLKQRYRGRNVDPGTMVEAESTIDLVVGLNSSNSETKIPDATGLNEREAVKRINDYYLNVRSIRYDRNVTTFEDSLRAVVYRQTPAPTELPVRMGTDVTLYLRVEEAAE